MSRKKPKPPTPVLPHNDRILVRVANGTRVMSFTESDIKELMDENRKLRGEAITPVPMILHCPECKTRHIDAGEFAVKFHHTHACQHCGFVWRPAKVYTIGVKFLPGFKDMPPECGWVSDGIAGSFKITHVKGNEDAEPGQGSAGGNSQVGGGAG